MTRKEMVKELHIRMRNRRKRREKQITALFGLLCLFPAAGLCLLAKGSRGLTDQSTEMYTGSTMLFSNYGGYVLVSVIAFMAGIVLTVIIRNHLENIERDSSEKNDSIDDPGDDNQA